MATTVSTSSLLWVRIARSRSRPVLLVLTIMSGTDSLSVGLLLDGRSLLVKVGGNHWGIAGLSVLLCFFH
jgi:hypothetical protein